MTAALVVGRGQCTNNGREDGFGSPGQLRLGQQLNGMGDIEHPARRHGEQARLLNRFVSERSCGNAYRGDATALQVNQVAHTARRARASIGEGLDDGVGDPGDVIDQSQGCWLGEDLFGFAGNDRPRGLQ